MSKAIFVGRHVNTPDVDQVIIIDDKYKRDYTGLIGPFTTKRGARYYIRYMEVFGKSTAPSIKEMELAAKAEWAERKAI